MTKKLCYGLFWVMLAGCADTKEKYRDIKHLEMPPTLAIDRAGGNAYSAAAKTETAAEPVTAQTTNSDLGKLILLGGSAEQPILQLKTRFERAWDLVDHGLRLAEVEVLDKNRDSGVFKVRYVADGSTKSRGVLSSVTSFFSDSLADTEYTLKVDKDRSITGVRAQKVNSSNQGETGNTETANNDDSASLIKLLHKTIIADLEK